MIQNALTIAGERGLSLQDGVEVERTGRIGPILGWIVGRQRILNKQINAGRALIQKTATSRTGDALS